MCYHEHRVNDDPYHHIGEQDITAHVNFSALNHWGVKNGLECCGFTDQGCFLRSLGLMDYLRALEQNSACNGFAGPEKAIAIYNLLNDIGTKLKVFIQQKGLAPKALTGLALARMPV
jgi:SAM-dependent MidA family methyltransferase